MKAKRRLKGKLAELAGGFLETPAPILAGGYSVTITNGTEAYITGCRAITAYDASHIKIETEDEATLSVFGCELDIAGYADTEITVRGRIECVKIDDGETLC